MFPKVAKNTHAVQVVIGGSRAFGTASFQAKDLIVEKTKKPKPKPEGTVPFGTIYSDHMAEIDWNESRGWDIPKIVPYHNFELDPANSTLHYALECFEGMKGYIDVDGKTRMFRPLENCKRMLTSFEALHFPAFDPEELNKVIKELVLIEKDWIPRKPLHSLYIRPSGISMTNLLGVSKATDVKLFVITSPVGAYFPSGFKAIKLYCETEFARAWKKGGGSKKLGANYGPTIHYAELAKDKGYSQILWLTDERYVSEVGAMNIFFVWKNKKGQKELVTPMLDGTILPGVTRRSILELWKEKKELEVIEKPIDISEVVETIKDGRMIESFGAGTAAICCPVNGISYQGKEYNIPINEKTQCGEYTEKTLNTIQDIQYGKIEHPWSVKLE